MYPISLVVDFLTFVDLYVSMSAYDRRSVRIQATIIRPIAKTLRSDPLVSGVLLVVRIMTIPRLLR